MIERFESRVLDALYQSVYLTHTKSSSPSTDHSLKRHVKLLPYTSFLSGTITRNGSTGRGCPNQRVFIMLLPRCAVAETVHNYPCSSSLHLTHFFAQIHLSVLK